jgi:hypothetical protein
MLIFSYKVGLAYLIILLKDIPAIFVLYESE